MDLDARVDAPARRATLSWRTPPEETAVPSKYYVIKFREEAGRWKWLNTVFVPARQRWYEASLAAPGRYRFHVGALASCGAGTPTQIEIHVSTEAPSPPQSTPQPGPFAEGPTAAILPQPEGNAREADLGRPPGGRHAAHLYRDSADVASTVAAWSADSLRGGGGAIVIATPANGALILARLREDGHDVDGHRAAGRLRVLDARETLAKFVVGGVPDNIRFERLVAAEVTTLRAACGGARARIHLWGEMVNILRERGNVAAAQKLEAAWSDLIAREGVALLCSYQSDPLAPDTYTSLLPDVCRHHTHLVREEGPDGFDGAVGCALVDEFGEGKADAARARYLERVKPGTVMPATDALLLSIHETEPTLGHRILERMRAHLRAPGTY